MSGQFQSPAALPSRKDPRYQFDRRQGGTQSRSGRGGEEKNSQPPPAIEPPNPDRPARSLVVVLTEGIINPELWLENHLGAVV
jgi:hypothetical protein